MFAYALTISYSNYGYFSVAGKNYHNRATFYSSKETRSQIWSDSGTVSLLTTHADVFKGTALCVTGTEITVYNGSYDEANASGSCGSGSYHGRGVTGVSNGSGGISYYFTFDTASQNL